MGGGSDLTNAAGLHGGREDVFQRRVENGFKGQGDIELGDGTLNDAVQLLRRQSDPSSAFARRQLTGREELLEVVRDLETSDLNAWRFRRLRADAARHV